jgi:hypothetical protein
MNSLSNFIDGRFVTQFLFLLKGGSQIGSFFKLIIWITAAQLAAFILLPFVQVGVTV